MQKTNSKTSSFLWYFGQVWLGSKSARIAWYNVWQELSDFSSDVLTNVLCLW